MRCTTVLLLGAALSACAAAHGPPVEDGAVSTRLDGQAPHSVKTGCVDALLLVVRDTATGAAVDPVETQIGLLGSKSFAKGVPAASDPRGVLSVERVGRSALVRLRFDADPPRALATCQWVVDRALRYRVEDGSDEWLSRHEATLERDLKSEEEALAAFDREHNTASIQPEQRKAMLADRLLQLERERPSARTEMSRLSEQLVEAEILRASRERLTRRTEQLRKLLNRVREHRAEAKLRSLLSAPLQLVDPCSPCGEDDVDEAE